MKSSGAEGEPRRNEDGGVFLPKTWPKPENKGEKDLLFGNIKRIGYIR